MTIRYAAARAVSQPVYLTRIALGRLTVGAANDNGDPLRHDLVLRAALLHFAEHGLRAAEDAAGRAKAAHLRGVRADYRQWIEICRALDPRRAGSLGKVLARRGKARGRVSPS